MFSPRRSPIGNLACLLNVADDRIGFTYEPRMLSRWRAVEDDKALYLLRDMTLVDDESENESVPNKECISEIREKDFDESVTKELVPKKVTVRDRDLVPIIDLMRGDETAPCEYYYHVMRDFEEISQFLESIEGGLQTPIKGMHNNNNLILYKLCRHFKWSYLLIFCFDLYRKEDRSLYL